jgi:IS1 family transposase
VVEHFSGYLCVDEVHDGPYCIFYAVDARLQKRIAFQISDSAGKAECLQFLQSLKGLKVRGLTTDGLTIYRHTVPEVFGAARHQVCVFHVLKELNESVMRVLAVFRKSLPKPPPRQRGRPRLDEARPGEHPMTRLKGEIWTNRFAWVLKHPSRAQRRTIRRLGRRFPLLAALREFVDRLYQLFDRRCRRLTAQLKLQDLRRHRMFQRFPQLDQIRRELASPNLSKALEFLDDPNLAATNNAVERENRRHRKRQKTIYRARTRETIAARIRFSMVHDVHPVPLNPGKDQQTQHKRRAG